MACRLSYGRSATSTILVLLVLLEAVLVLEQVSGAPAQQRGNDILAGTEFLSVFINGAMAPVPVAPPSPRRRGFRRGGGAGMYSTSDNVPAEARHSEASIYRISRAPSSPRPIVTRSGHREEGVRLYPINHKSMESRDSLTTLSGEIGNSGELGTIVKQGQQQAPQRVQQQQQQQQQKISATLNRETITKLNSTAISVSADSSAIGRGRLTGKNVNQKVIGVSVTSTVEATPYKVRVEHHDPDRKLSVVTRPPTIESTSTVESIGPIVTTTPGTGSLSAASLTTGTATTSTTGRPTTTTASTTKTTTSTTTVTALPAQLVTEELSNIVSESNRSEFSVDEGLPKTSWRNRSPVTTGSILSRSSTPASSSSSFTSTSSFSRGHHGKDDDLRDSEETSTSLEPVEESYELPEVDSEPREIHNEQSEIPERVHQGRKAGRHYDATLYNQPPKVYPHQTSKIYGKSSRGYGEAAKNSYPQPEMNYGEPARVYSEPAKIYSEPSRIYGEPSKIYSEPAKVYGEPERVYGEPAKVYSEPARVYGEPAKVYSEPAKIYSEPSKIYGADGRPVMHRIYEEEPTEENHEIDEAVSVGSNGNVHGPQIITEAPPSNSTPSPGAASHDNPDGKKVSYVFEDRKYRKYRVEERTSDGFIVGEYGVVSHDDGSLRAVRYTADSNIDPKVIYEALMKFLNLK